MRRRSVSLQAWLPPTFVLAMSLFYVSLSTKRGESLALLFLAALLLGLLVFAGARRPLLMVCVLAVFVPLQTAILAFLYAIGVPGGAVRGLGFVKEAAVAALVLAAIQHSVRSERRVVVGIAATYLTLVAGFLVLPAVAPGVLYDFPLGVRLLAGRSECLGIVALVALCHLRLPADALRRVGTCVVVTGVILGAGAIWQIIPGSGFDQFGETFLHITAFRRDVLGADDALGRSLTLTTVQSGAITIRAGSFLYEPLTLAFYLIIPFALLCARLTLRYRFTDIVGLAVVASGLLATSTRSSAVAAAVAAVAVVALSQGAARARATAALAALGALVGGSVGASLLRRLAEAQGGQDASTLEHKRLTQLAYQAFLDNPLGRGLGASPGSGIRQRANGALTAENAYLAVGLETGLLGLALFVGLLLASMLAVGRGARDDAWRRGLVAAGIGLTVSGFFLHTWSPFAVSLTYWPIVGVALARSREPAPPTPAGPTVVAGHPTTSGPFAMV